MDFDGESREDEDEDGMNPSGKGASMIKLPLSVIHGPAFEVPPMRITGATAPRAVRRART